MDQSVVIGTVGRLVPVKNHAQLVRAFAAVVKGGPDRSMSLVIIGDGPLRESLKSLAQECGVADQVHFPGASNRIPELLRTLDVFALTSVNEGTSNTILEAMAAGLPVIATAVGGNPELVSVGETGYLYDSGDPSSLAAAISRYVADPALRRAHGRQSRLKVEENFGLDTMVRSYTKLYEELNKD